MLRTLLATALALGATTVVPAQPAAGNAAGAEYHTVPITIALWSGFSEHGAKRRNIVAWNLFAGRADRLDGIQASFFYNRIDGDIGGYATSAVASEVHGSVNGGLLDGIYSRIDGNLDGYGAAGIYGEVRGNVHGDEFAGIASVVRGHVRGEQASAFYARARSVTGGQSALVTHADSIEGVQAGLFNYAKSVQGMQFGIVNVAERIDGVPIGLISLVKGVPIRFDAWYDESNFATFAVRSGTPKWHSIMTGGWQTVGDSTRWKLGVGLGAELPVSGPTFADIEYLVYALSKPGGAPSGNRHLSTLRASLVWRIAPRLAFVAGASMNLFVGRYDDGQDIPPWTLYHHDWTKVHMRVWPGVFAGIRI